MLDIHTSLAGTFWFRNIDIQSIRGFQKCTHTYVFFWLLGCHGIRSPTPVNFRWHFLHLLFSHWSFFFFLQFSLSFLSFFLSSFSFPSLHLSSFSPRVWKGAIFIRCDRRMLPAFCGGSGSGPRSCYRTSTNYSPRAGCKRQSFFIHYLVVSERLTST